MEIQEILAYSALVFAIIFLAKKFFFKSKNKNKRDCGSGDCACH